jgi:peptide/nickel transport system permease protein
MIQYFVTKAVRSLFTIWLVVSFVFVVLRLSGDPTRILLPEDTPPAIVELYAQKWGLDRPIWEQYVTYIERILQGDFGRSFFDGRDALQMVMERVPLTLHLGLVALAITLVFGLTFGILAAIYRSSALDRTIMAVSVVAYGLPNYFLGILLILFFSLEMRWLPSAGAGTWKHILMPAVTLGLSSAAIIARFTRSAMLEVLRQSYMRTARAKGLRWWQQLAWHAIPNAAIPVVTILGFQVGWIIGGAFVVETVFAWPGIGRLFIQSTGVRDFSVVQTIVLLISVSVILTNLTIDLAYGWIDPRIRRSART